MSKLTRQEAYDIVLSRLKYLAHLCCAGRPVNENQLATELIDLLGFDETTLLDVSGNGRHLVETFRCPSCNQDVPVSQGAADESHRLCDECATKGTLMTNSYDPKNASELFSRNSKLDIPSLKERTNQILWSARHVEFERARKYMDGELPMNLDDLIESLHTALGRALSARIAESAGD